MQENSSEIILEDKDVTITDAAQVSSDSPIAAKVKKIEQEAEKKRQLEIRRSERIRVQQDYIGSMIDNITDSLAATEKEKQVNDVLETDVKKQVLSMHGLSEDKLEGISRRNAAIFQGSEFALFFMSVVLVAVSGFLNGMSSDITLFLCFFTAIEGTLLNHAKRPGPIVWILRIIYMIIFPVMLTVFVLHMLAVAEKADMSVFSMVVSVSSAVGILILILGVISYFLYNPYKNDRKQLKKAKKYLKDMEKAADKEVSKNIKQAEKQQKKEEKQQARLEKKEERQKAKLEKQEAKQKEKSERSEEKQKTDTEKKEEEQEQNNKSEKENDQTEKSGQEDNVNGTEN